MAGVYCESVGLLRSNSVLAAVALGSNLGDRRGFLNAAVARLREVPGTTVEAVSTFIETVPVGDVSQGLFLNGAAVLRTSCSARELLEALHAIERFQGRSRVNERRWGPRTLDLDLLTHGDLVSTEPELTIPHPRLHERRFVLEPLAEIAPGLMVPGRGVVRELLAALGPG